MTAFPAWYYPRASDILTARLLSSNNGVRACLITGAPGVGKTAFARALAEALGAEHLYFLAHHWVSEEDLFVRIDPARVAGLAGGVYSELEEAYRPGVLLRAVEASRNGLVVLCLDEWDKSADRCDALLLDFLQTGAVHGPFGQVWSANLKNLIVIITSNGVRELAEPLLRRVFRYEMPFLPPAIEADLIRKASGVSTVIAKLIVAFMNQIRNDGTSSPSLQEGIKLAQSLKQTQSSSDVDLLIRGWLCKSEEDYEALVNKFKQPAAILWGEIRR